MTRKQQRPQYLQGVVYDESSGLVIDRAPCERSMDGSQLAAFDADQLCKLQGCGTEFSYIYDASQNAYFKA